MPSTIGPRRSRRGLSLVAQASVFFLRISRNAPITTIRPSTIQISFRSGFSSVVAGSSVAATTGVSVVAGAASAGAGSAAALRALQRKLQQSERGFSGGHFSGGGFRNVEYGLHILCREDLRGSGRDDRGRQHVASLQVGQAHGLAIHDDLDAALFELALGELAGRAVLGLHVDGVKDPLHYRAFLDRGYVDRANFVVVVIWAVPFIPG